MKQEHTLTINGKEMVVAMEDMFKKIQEMDDNEWDYDVTNGKSKAQYIKDILKKLKKVDNDNAKWYQKRITQLNAELMVEALEKD